MEFSTTAGVKYEFELANIRLFYIQNFLKG